MNSVNLHGRLTKDPEIRTTQSGKLVAKFFIAVDSRSKDAQGNRTADFIPCVMFGKRAETARSYLRKGSEITASGMDSRTGTKWQEPGLFTGWNKGVKHDRDKEQNDLEGN